MGPAEGAGVTLRTLSQLRTQRDDGSRSGGRAPICLEGRLQAWNYGSQICTYLGLLLKRLGFKYHPITHTCPATWKLQSGPARPGARPRLREEVPVAGPTLTGGGAAPSSCPPGPSRRGSRGLPGRRKVSGRPEDGDGGGGWGGGEGADGPAAVPGRAGLSPASAPARGTEGPLTARSSGPGRVSCPLRTSVCRPSNGPQ